MSLEQHELGRIVAQRGEGGKRTTFFAYCSCGWGTPSSANPTSVEKKHRAHVEHVSGPRPGIDRASPRWKRIRGALCEDTGLGQLMSLDVYADQIFALVQNATGGAS